VLEAIGLGGDDNAQRRLTVLRAIDKLDKFGIEGVKLLLGPSAAVAVTMAWSRASWASRCRQPVSPSASRG
jgi:hypothetical protein